MVVHPSSHRVSRVRRYSGYPLSVFPFVYGALTLCGRLSHAVQLGTSDRDAGPNPDDPEGPSVWPPPRSLATTGGISVDVFSSPYLDVSVQAVPHVLLFYSQHVDTVLPCRVSPHSDIHGSRDICSSPWLFAACRVLHRLLMPRHSPCALISLTFVGINCASFASAVRLRLLAKAHTAPFVPPLKSETRFRFVGEMVAAQFNPRYGLIAVLRIMQALQKICVCCVLPLKFHITLLLLCIKHSALCCLA